MCETCNTQWYFISLGTTDYGIYEFQISICDDDEVHWLQAFRYKSSIALHQLHWLLVAVHDSWVCTCVFNSTTVYRLMSVCSFRASTNSLTRSHPLMHTKMVIFARNPKPAHTHIRTLYRWSNESNDISLNNISNSQNVFLSTFSVLNVRQFNFQYWTDTRKLPQSR